MKYLSLFSGIGGFELGIQQAYENLQDRKYLSKRRSSGSSGGRLGRESDNSVWKKGRDSKHADCINCSESKSERQQAYEQTKKNRSLGNGKQPAEKADIRQESPVSNSPSKLGNGGWECPECIGFSEIDKYAVQIYQKHFNHKNYGDITKINPTDLPYFDLLVGGFPCQSFSIAGKRGGFADTRGTLFFEIARIIKQKQPRLLLLENVKGLLSHDKGNTFTTIISTLDELGYDCQWQVLNSKDFGVPQNRERVFIIGHLRETPRPKVFPFEESNETHLKEITQEVSDAQRIYDSSGLAKSQKALGGGLGAKTGLYQIKETGIRRLTPIECERLQGFPDGWTKYGSECPEVCNLLDYGENCVKCDYGIKEMSDTQRYKTLGNAVTVNVIVEIMKRLLST